MHIGVVKDRLDGMRTWKKAILGIFLFSAFVSIGGFTAIIIAKEYWAGDMTPSSRPGTGSGGSERPNFPAPKSPPRRSPRRDSRRRTTDDRYERNERRRDRNRNGGHSRRNFQTSEPLVDATLNFNQSLTNKDVRLFRRSYSNSSSRSDDVRSPRRRQSRRNQSQRRRKSPKREKYWFESSSSGDRDDRQENRNNRQKSPSRTPKSLARDSTKRYRSRKRSISNDSSSSTDDWQRRQRESRRNRDKSYDRHSPRNYVPGLRYSRAPSQTALLNNCDYYHYLQPPRKGPLGIRGPHCHLTNHPDYLDPPPPPHYYESSGTVVPRFNSYRERLDWMERKYGMRYGEAPPEWHEAYTMNYPRGHQDNHYSASEPAWKQPPYDPFLPRNPLTPNTTNPFSQRQSLNPFAAPTVNQNPFQPNNNPFQGNYQSSYYPSTSAMLLPNNQSQPQFSAPMSFPNQAQVSSLNPFQNVNSMQSSFPQIIANPNQAVPSSTAHLQQFNNPFASAQAGIYNLSSQPSNQANVLVIPQANANLTAPIPPSSSNQPAIYYINGSSQTGNEIAVLPQAAQVPNQVAPTSNLLQPRSSSLQTNPLLRNNTQPGNFTTQLDASLGRVSTAFRSETGNINRRSTVSRVLSSLQANNGGRNAGSHLLRHFNNNM